MRGREDQLLAFGLWLLACFNGACLVDSFQSDGAVIVRNLAKS
jgi:hypothetical protein